MSPLPVLPLLIGPIGMQEMLIIMVLALIVFGPRKLPKIGKTLGRSLAEFRRTSTELRNTLEREVQIEEFREARKTASGVRNDVRSAFTGGLDPKGGQPGGFRPPTPVRPEGGGESASGQTPASGPAAADGPAADGPAAGGPANAGPTEEPTNGEANGTPSAEPEPAAAEADSAPAVSGDEPADGAAGGEPASDGGDPSGRS